MRRRIAFSIDFEGYVEAMEESFEISPSLPRFEIGDELEANTERTLALLDEHGVRGTFFVLGWIGDRFPRLVRTIADSGHEIGSHSYYHRRLTDLDASRRDEIARSKRVLEDATGVECAGFRAPDFSLPPGEALFELLREIGFRYDASLNPTSVHDVYGRAGAPRGIHRRPCGLVEFPPATAAIGGSVVTVGGGGYFRLFPWSVTRWALCRAPAAMTYLHPYEIGGIYPRDVPMSRLRRFRHGYRNGRLGDRLAKLFREFEAVPVRSYLEAHGELA